MCLGMFSFFVKIAFGVVFIYVMNIFECLCTTSVESVSLCVCFSTLYDNISFHKFILFPTQSSTRDIQILKINPNPEQRTIYNE